MIYTSYYANVKNIDKNNYILIQISNSAPFDTDYKLNTFIPDWETIVNPHKKGEITDEEFKTRYIKQLEDNQYSIKTIIDYLLTSDKPIILLCYEKLGDFCHRHILAEFVNKIFEEEIIKEFGM